MMSELDKSYLDSMDKHLPVYSKCEEVVEVETSKCLGEISTALQNIDPSVTDDMHSSYQQELPSINNFMDTSQVAEVLSKTVGVESIDGDARIEELTEEFEVQEKVKDGEERHDWHYSRETLLSLMESEVFAYKSKALIPTLPQLTNRRPTKISAANGENGYNNLRPPPGFHIEDVQSDEVVITKETNNTSDEMRINSNAMNYQQKFQDTKTNEDVDAAPKTDEADPVSPDPERLRRTQLQLVELVRTSEGGQIKLERIISEYCKASNAFLNPSEFGFDDMKGLIESTYPSLCITIIPDKPTHSSFFNRPTNQNFFNTNKTQRFNQCCIVRYHSKLKSTQEMLLTCLLTHTIAECTHYVVDAPIDHTPRFGGLSISKLSTEFKKRFGYIASLHALMKCCNIQNLKQFLNELPGVDVIVLTEDIRIRISRGVHLPNLECALYMFNHSGGLRRSSIFSNTSLKSSNELSTKKQDVRQELKRNTSVSGVKNMIEIRRPSMAAVDASHTMKETSIPVELFPLLVKMKRTAPTHTKNEKSIEVLNTSKAEEECVGVCTLTTQEMKLMDRPSNEEEASTAIDSNKMHMMQPKDTVVIEAMNSEGGVDGYTNEKSIIDNRPPQPFVSRRRLKSTIQSSSYLNEMGHPPSSNTMSSRIRQSEEPPVVSIDTTGSTAATSSMRFQLRRMIFELIAIGCERQKQQWCKGEDLVELEEEETLEYESGRRTVEESGDELPGGTPHKGSVDDSVRIPPEEGGSNSSGGNHSEKDRTERRIRKKREKKENRRRKKAKLRVLEKSLETTKEGDVSYISGESVEDRRNIIKNVGIIPNSDNNLNDTMVDKIKEDEGIQNDANNKLSAIPSPLPLLSSLPPNEIEDRRRIYRLRSVGLLVSTIKADWIRRYGEQFPLSTYMNYFRIRKMKFLLQEVPNLIIHGSGGSMRVATVEHTKMVWDGLPAKWQDSGIWLKIPCYGTPLSTMQTFRTHNYIHLASNNNSSLPFNHSNSYSPNQTVMNQRCEEGGGREKSVSQKYDTQRAVEIESSMRVKNEGRERVKGRDISSIGIEDNTEYTQSTNIESCTTNTSVKGQKELKQHLCRLMLHLISHVCKHRPSPQVEDGGKTTNTRAVDGINEEQTVTAGLRIADIPREWFKLYGFHLSQLLKEAGLNDIKELITAMKHILVVGHDEDKRCIIVLPSQKQATGGIKQSNKPVPLQGEVPSDSKTIQHPTGSYGVVNAAPPVASTSETSSQDNSMRVAKAMAVIKQTSTAQIAAINALVKMLAKNEEKPQSDDALPAKQLVQRSSTQEETPPITTGDPEAINSLLVHLLSNLQLAITNAKTSPQEAERKAVPEPNSTPPHGVVHIEPRTTYDCDTHLSKEPKAPPRSSRTIRQDLLQALAAAECINANLVRRNNQNYDFNVTPNTSEGTMYGNHTRHTPRGQQEGPFHFDEQTIAPPVLQRQAPYKDDLQRKILQPGGEHNKIEGDIYRHPQYAPTQPTAYKLPTKQKKRLNPYPRNFAPNHQRITKR